jgi:ParB/RepB/Spo0J family partition protein
MEELAASVARDGVIEPLVVRAAPDGSAGFEVIAGHRRLEAAKRAGLATVPVIVKTAERVRGMQLAENIQREDLPPLDIAHGIAALMLEEGIDGDHAAARLGLSTRKVQRYLQLERAPEVIKRALTTGVRVEVETPEGKKSVTGRLDFRSAIEAMRIFNHLGKTDDSVGQKKATARVERLLETAVREGWTFRDYEAAAARIAAGKTGGAGKSDRMAPESRPLFDEAAGRVVVHVGRLAAATADQRAALLARLRELVAKVDEAIQNAKPVAVSGSDS